jgi:GMP synthase (glutamine-hydrolysing)
MKSAIAIRFVNFEDLGTFESVLESQGFSIRYVEAASLALEPAEAIEADLLISLGGPIGAYEDDAYPCLKPILAMLGQRIALDLPTLGICLGAQLIARALGARVYPGSGKEIGWSPLSVTAAGQLSPVRHLGSTPTLHWHGDTFDLPPGSTLLASTDRYPNQAFAFGRNILGLQFHPEVTHKRLEHWYIGHACEIAAAPGVEVIDLRADSARFARSQQLASERFLLEWIQRSVARHEGNRDGVATLADRVTD